MKHATECNFCAAVNLLDPQEFVVPCCGCGLLLRNKHATTNPELAPVVINPDRDGGGAP
jgi:hypothetical protein